MSLISDLKGIGYLVSTASVALLGAVAWDSAARDPQMLACLVAGVLLAVAGMVLRWYSHRLQRKEQNRGGVPRR